MRRPPRAALALVAGLLAAPTCAQSLSEVPAIDPTEIVTATPIATFAGAEIGEPVGNGLIWRGGLVLQGSTDRFGGISGAGFTNADGHLVMVSDHGNFVAGQLLYNDAGRPFSLVGVTIAPIQNSKGADLPLAYTRDAESLAIVERDGTPVAVRVGFENLTRVADFDLVNNVPVGAAREVSIPSWVSDLRTNESLESVCVAPRTSPIAGSTLLIVEATGADGNHPATLLGNRDKGDLKVAHEPGVNPTDCAFLPNGDLLILDRGLGFLSFVSKLRRIPAADVRPGAVLQGEILLEASGSDIDNMEALAIHPGPDGQPRITIMSDNNFNSFERNLLLEFSFADGAT